MKLFSPLKNCPENPGFISRNNQSWNILEKRATLISWKCLDRFRFPFSTCHGSASLRSSGPWNAQVMGQTWRFVWTPLLDSSSLWKSVLNKRTGLRTVRQKLSESKIFWGLGLFLIISEFWMKAYVFHISPECLFSAMQSYFDGSLS